MLESDFFVYRYYESFLFWVQNNRNCKEKWVLFVGRFFSSLHIKLYVYVHTNTSIITNRTVYNNEYPVAWHYSIRFHSCLILLCPASSLLLWMTIRFTTIGFLPATRRSARLAKVDTICIRFNVAHADFLRQIRGIWHGLPLSPNER